MVKSKFIVLSVLMVLIGNLGFLIAYETVHVEGLAKQYDIDLPQFNNTIQMAIDKLEVKKVKFKSLIYVDGWAFINNQNSNSQKTYVVLHSDEDNYIFDTKGIERLDLPKAFNNYNAALEQAGFSSLLNMSNVKNGKYRIGIYIQNQKKSEFTLIDKYVMKADIGIELQQN